MEANDTKGSAPIDPIIKVVLDNFQAMFDEPSGLPLSGVLIIKSSTMRQ